MSASQWDKFLESYNQKKKIEEYQESRFLPRPKTTKITAAVYLALLLVIILVGGIVLFLVLPLAPWAKAFVFILYIIGITESYCRLVAIKIVECYQHYAKEETRRRCKCIPSCSEYAILCFKKFIFIYALIKIRKRLFVTCKGFDYIIDEP